MDAAVGIMGLLCLAMAVGHTAVGLIWVLPSVNETSFPRTPFGPPSMSIAMVRVAWFIVTIFAASVGGVLVTLAWVPDADPYAVVLRWFAVMWLVAAGMAFCVAVRRMRDLRQMTRSLLRLPVPFVWVLVAIVCWKASM